MKKFMFGFIAVIGSTLLTLALLEIILQFMPVRSYIPMEPVTLEDPVLRFKPNIEQHYAAGWDFDAQNTSRTNAQGYIADFDFVADDPKPLIAVIGDSYIEARMVPFQETVQQRLNVALGETHRVYGVGIGGSPLSQYLIFAKMMRDQYKPEFMIVNIVENDFDESMPRYKNMPRFHYFMPMRDGTFLPLLINQYMPSPIKELLSRSALVRFAYFHLNLADVTNNILFRLRGGSRKSSAEETPSIITEFNTRLAFSKLAVDTFLLLLQKYSGLPADRIILMLDGNRPFIYDGTDETPKAVNSYFGQMRNYMLQESRAYGYGIIDMHPVFRADYAERGQIFDYPGDAHWNSHAHSLAAEQILKSPALKAYLGQQ